MDYCCCPYGSVAQRAEGGLVELRMQEMARLILLVFELFPIVMDQLSWLRPVVGMWVAWEHSGRT